MAAGSEESDAIVARVTRGYLFSPGLRFARLIAVVAGIAFGLLGALGGLLFQFAALFLPFVPLAPFARANSTTSLRIAPGEVRAEALRLRAADVVAATSAEIEGGVSIALSLRAQSEPILLEVATAAEAKRVLEALGVGETGAGRELRFADDSVAAESFALATMAALVAWLAAHWAHTMEIAWYEGSLLVGVLAMAFGFALSHRMSNAVMLTRTGVESASGVVLYRDIRFVRTEQMSLRIDTYDGKVFWYRLPLRGFAAQREVELVAHHVLAAAKRAQSPWPAKLDPPRVLLARNADARAYLAELDAAAAQVGEAGGYRSEALVAADLEKILHDGDRAPTMRVAAARLLLKSGADRTRIDAALATLHGQRTAERARVAAGLAESPEDEAAAFEEIAGEENATRA